MTATDLVDYRLRRILVVDDEENIRQMLRAVLEKEGLTVLLAGSAREALELLDLSVDVLLSDVRMPGMGGLDLLAEARSRRPDLVVVMMSAYGTVDTAIEAIKQGAYDYIAKPFKPAEVVLLLRKAEERERLKRDNARLQRQLKSITLPSLGNMVARSAAMERVFRTIRKIAEYKSTVLIQGESGTGKELVAQALHQNSGRSGSFVPVNCGAIPDTLLESELFGHRRGAFTDARHDKKGLFEEADGGTLFLDEVTELPLVLQVKLLRVLQEEEVRPIGDTKGLTVNVRVVAATARDLQQEVEEGRFREDLFYRLNVLSITLPPLRDRLEDVPPLVDHFIGRHNARLGLSIEGIAHEALRHLMTHSWPGNVRELENTIERAMVLAEGSVIDQDTLPAKLREVVPSPSPELLSNVSSIKRATRIIEEMLIRRALKQTGGNRTNASKILEISHRALLYKIKEYGITNS